MKKVLLALVLVILMNSFLEFRCAAGKPIESHWRRGFEIMKMWLYVEADFTTARETPAPPAGPSCEGELPRAAKQACSLPHVHITLPTPFGRLSLDGQITDDTI
jgi:hypothetical protein